MLALADLVVSAWLVAVTTSLSAACGAVYRPDCVIVPVPWATVHVTPVFVDPETVAVNCCVHFAGIATLVGEMAIATFCGTVTATVAAADAVPSAALTAVTV